MKDLFFINHSIDMPEEPAIPVTVIIPTQKKRAEFLHQYVLSPLMTPEWPAQIIIHSGEGNAAKKRNEAFHHATQPYVLFLDDDKLLPKDYIKVLYNALKDNPDIDFVYTGYTGIVLHPETHPVKNNYRIKTREWDVKTLLQNNYIDTTSLMKREVFPYFDETLPQHDDWDLYLKMATMGRKGKAVHGLQFFSFFLDEGITSVNNKDCSDIIRNRYKAIL